MTTAVLSPGYVPEPVLLVFTPDAPVTPTALDRLLALARPVLPPDVRIVRVSDTTHPEVAQSFGLSARPGVVLLRQGEELWRCPDALAQPDLIPQLVARIRASLRPDDNQPGG